MQEVMDKLNQLYVRLFLCVRNERGQGLVEYALIIVLIAVAAIAAMKLLGGNINTAYSNAASRVAAP